MYIRNMYTNKISLIFLSTLFGISLCESPLHSYLPPRNAFAPATRQQGPHTHKKSPGILVIQVRSESGRPRIVLKRGPPPGGRLHHGIPSSAAPMRHIKPLRLVISPQLLLKGNRPNGRRKPTQITKIQFNSPKIPNGYVYDKPFSSTSAMPNFQINSIDDANANFHFGPIHTIPAPNLAHGADFIGNQYQFNGQGGNQLQHQYQVTEDYSNDQLVHDQLSGQIKYFAPDPDPSLPVKQISPSKDPFSMPSNGSPLPLDLQDSYRLPPQKLSRPPATSYGVPLSSISLNNMIDGVPLAVFNPSYLVSQSKNLYNQHKQQLFKPQATSPASSYGLDDLTQHVTNDGQILHSSKDELIPATPTPQEDLLVNSLALAPQIGSYAALIAQRPQSSAVSVSYDAQAIQPSAQHSLNLDNTVAQGGFVVSNYFGSQGSDLSQHQYLNIEPTSQSIASPTAQPHYYVSSTANPDQFFVHPAQQHQQQISAAEQNPYYVDASQHQTTNQETLDLANQHLQQQLFEHASQDYSTNQNIQQEISAYEQHQQFLGQQLASTPYGIYLPNNYQQPSNLHKRSDNFSKDNRSETKDGEIAVTMSTDYKPKDNSVQQAD